MDDFRDQLLVGTAELEGSGGAVSCPVANRTVVQTVEVAQPVGATRTGRLAATANGGAVCQTDWCDCATLDPVEHYLERWPAQSTKGGYHRAGLDRFHRRSS